MFIYIYISVWAVKIGHSQPKPKLNARHDRVQGLPVWPHHSQSTGGLFPGLDKVWNPRKADIARKGKSGEFQCLPKLQWMEEILHQLMGGLSHYLWGSNHPRWCRISSIKPYQTWKFMKIPLRRQIINFQPHFRMEMFPCFRSAGMQCEPPDVRRSSIPKPAEAAEDRAQNPWNKKSYALFSDTPVQSYRSFQASPMSNIATMG